MVQTNCVKPKIIIITGPTAVGKSDLAVKIAKLLNTEIISADSMQIYKGMDIGTGKVTEEEKQGVVHHMLDIISPDSEYSVSDYVEQTKVMISKLLTQTQIFQESALESNTFKKTLLTNFSANCTWVMKLKAWLQKFCLLVQ